MNSYNCMDILIKDIKRNNEEFFRLKKLKLNINAFLSFMFLLTLFIFMICDVFFEYNFTTLIIILFSLLFCSLVISDIYLDYKTKEIKKYLKKNY